MALNQQKKQKLICIDGCMFNVSKHNLKIMDIIPLHNN